MTNIYKTIIVGLFKLFFRHIYCGFKTELSDPKKAQLKLRKELKNMYLQSSRYEKTKVAFENLEVKTYNELIDICPVEELVAQKIRCFEETSGSSGIRKRIPYTDKLLGSFSSMFCLWAYDILKNVPLKSYKFYFSISPHFIANENAAEVGGKNGLEDDSDYLGPILSKFISPFIIELRGAKGIRDSDEFLMGLALTLVSAKDLEIISIWSPTFLISLIEYIDGHKDEFKTHLHNGYYKGHHFEPRDISSFDLVELFPSLRLISCWGSASAERNFNKLEGLFGSRVVFQKKGLLATEAPMTMPLYNYPGGIPLIFDVFFEFLTEESEIKYLWEIEEGEAYELIISQKGGLIRYPMKDRVKVVGFVKKTPLLEFIGRGTQVSDLVGEKLNETDVFSCVQSVGATALIASTNESRYFLLTDLDFDELRLEEVENLLRVNPHYHNARELRQLNSLEVIKIKDPEDSLLKYNTLILGINSGDIKDSTLIYRKGDLFLKMLLDQIQASS
jgi:hypothetical protein